MSRFKRLINKGKVRIKNRVRILIINRISNRNNLVLLQTILSRLLKDFHSWTKKVMISRLRLRH
jgi:hypothetical protein